MWHRTDDGFRNHAKTKKAARAEPMAIALWLLVGTAVSEALTDGVVSADMIDDVAFTLSMKTPHTQRCVDALVTSGLWHDPKTIRACHCKIASKLLAPDGAFFHDWWDYHPTHNQALIPIDRLRWERRQDLLHNRKLCKAIVARDGDRCRYCAATVNFADRKGANGGTYDHLDPTLLDAPDFARANSLRNVVVACRRCNGQKKDRNPTEWVAAGGRPLLPVPEPFDLSEIDSGSDPDQILVQADLTSRARHTRDGSDRNGSAPDLISIQSTADHDETR